MDGNPAPKNPISVEIRSDDTETRIEQVSAAENGMRRIRLYIWHSGHPQAGHVELAEKELVTLLARAVRAGVLSPDFIKSLRSEFEI